MSLTAGMRVGPYEILSRIGAGGMGEVYRARDPRVGRDVAIKIPNEQVSERFRREARAVATLNHPNICQLYDVGPEYLDMELIPGNSPKGPLPVREVLHIARQFAAALDAAHENGIVHRDLKPGNIRIKPDGTVKVLNFGLAMVAPSSGGEPEDSPTGTVSLTEVGTVMGSAPYMSPEQAQGLPVDKRTDIWAFGVVLYELVTGTSPYRGGTVQETLALVLTKEADLSKVPAQLRLLLRRCLEKDPKERLRDIGDAMALVDDVQVPASRRAPLVAVAAILIAAVAGMASWLGSRTTQQRADLQPLRFSVDLGPDAVPGPGMTVAVSPDGTRVVYAVRTAAGQRTLAGRALDQLQPTILAGTEGAGDPFFSHDGSGSGSRQPAS
jgi:serine/threonine protein kinase